MAKRDIKQLYADGRMTAEAAIHQATLRKAIAAANGKAMVTLPAKCVDALINAARRRTHGKPHV